MSILSLAITALGVTWLTVATIIGSTLGDEWTFSIILSFAHVGIGFGIAIIGLCRRD